jgi:hypothetical protein
MNAMKEQQMQSYPLTFEGTWAAIQESNRFLTEKFAKTDRQITKNDRLIRKKFAKTEQLIDKNAQRMKELNELVGAWSKNHGDFAEEYFINSFENGHQTFFGEKFDEMEQNVKGITRDYKDEYDIVLLNGKSVGIVEIKFRAKKEHIPKILRKAETFRINCPEYKNHQIFLSLASFCFQDGVEEECTDKGIAIIKQMGDMVVINDAHLKVF